MFLQSGHLPLHSSPLLRNNCLTLDFSQRLQERETKIKTFYSTV